MLKNLSIAIKSPLGSFLACLFIAMLSFSFVSVYNKTTNANRAYQGAVSDMQTINNFKQDIEGAQNDFSQSVILTNIHEDSKVIAKYTQSTLYNVEKALKALIEIEADAAATSGEEKSVERLKLIETSLKNYKQAIKDCFDVVGTDPMSLTILLPSVAAEFEKMSKGIEEVSVSFNGRADLARAMAEQAMVSGFNQAVIGGLIAIILTALIGIFLGRSIAKPIQFLTKQMLDLANGDLSFEIKGSDRKDEIGKMAAAVQVFKDNEIKVDGLKKAQAEADKRSKEERHKALVSMADEFEGTVKKVVQSVADRAKGMQMAARELSELSKDITDRSSKTSAVTEEASLSVSNVASATEELSASIGEIAHQVSEANRISQLAYDKSEHTNRDIQSLHEMANKIGDVVSMIKGIADQTNLLALNATIEAARAGDAGKGFAVVAGEVKTLASETAKATDEISTQVTAVQKNTEVSVVSIAEVGHVLQQVKEMSLTLEAAVAEQDAATKEISRNISQAADGTEEVARNVSSTSEAFIRAGSVANNVLNEATELLRESEHLQNDVDKFINHIRQD